MAFSRESIFARIYLALGGGPFECSRVYRGLAPLCGRFGIPPAVLELNPVAPAFLPPAILEVLGGLFRD